MWWWRRSRRRLARRGQFLSSEGQWIASHFARVEVRVKVASRCGTALSLALFCVALAGCGDGSSGGAGADPRSVDTQLLRAEVDGPQAKAFYEGRGWTAAWDDRNAEQLRAAIARAPEHGLKPDMFLNALPNDPSRRELAFTRAALLYASALASGHVDPNSLGKIYTIPRPRPNLAAGLAWALDASEVSQWLDSLAPQTDEYRALSQAYLQFRQLASQVRAEPVASGGMIRPGRRDPRMPTVVAALKANGYLGAEQAEQADPQRYTRPLVQAVQRLQADYGLKPDGVVGPDTIEAMNRGPTDRARRLAVGLERLRWTGRNPPATRIDVNTAASFLDYFRNGSHAGRRRVINGEPGWETPQLQSPIFRLVANPIWRVPDSIYEDELASKGAAYYAANHMTFRDGRLVQLPGPKNALGQVKFDMKNDNAIYLHDTPAKILFAQPERHRSHGCVRVEGALDFAMMLASEQGVLPSLQEGLMEVDESFINLKQEIPVRLLYRTAYFDNGEVKLVPDVYGWDNAVAQALGLGGIPPRRPPVQRRGVDIGP